jgi:hypothetical protein
LPTGAAKAAGARSEQRDRQLRGGGHGLAGRGPHGRSLVTSRSLVTGRSLITGGD